MAARRPKLQEENVQMPPFRCLETTETPVLGHETHGNETFSELKEVSKSF